MRLAISVHRDHRVSTNRHRAVHHHFVFLPIPGYFRSVRAKVFVRKRYHAATGTHRLLFQRAIRGLARPGSIGHQLQRDCFLVRRVAAVAVSTPNALWSNYLFTRRLRLLKRIRGHRLCLFVVTSTLRNPASNVTASVRRAVRLTLPIGSGLGHNDGQFV